MQVKKKKKTTTTNHQNDVQTMTYESFLYCKCKITLQKKIKGEGLK